MAVIKLKRPAVCADPDCGADLKVGARARYYGAGRVYGFECHARATETVRETSSQSSSAPVEHETAPDLPAEPVAARSVGVPWSADVVTSAPDIPAGVTFEPGPGNPYRASSAPARIASGSIGWAGVADALEVASVDVEAEESTETVEETAAAVFPVWFETDRKALLAGVRTVLKAMGTRVGIPALSGVFVETGPDSVTMTGTDLELTCRLSIPAKVRAQGSALLIPARLLADMLKQAPGETVELEANDASTVRISSGGTSPMVTSVRLLPAEDFPRIEGPAPAVLRIEAERWARLARVEPSASRDMARPTLSGVLVEVDGQTGPGVTVVATDSYTLATATETDCLTFGDGAAAIIPARAFKILGGILGKRPKGTVRLSIEQGSATFELEERDVWIMSRTIEGQFPNWRQLMPEGTEEGTGELTGLSVLDVKAAGTMARENSPVRLELNGFVRLRSTSPDLGDSVLETSASWSGEELTVAYSPAYLERVLAIAGDGARVFIRDGLKPATVLGTDGVRALVMPVRLPAPVGGA